MKVIIPFKEEFKERMVSGKKTCTSRTKRYGITGDKFKIFGMEFELTRVQQVELFEIANNQFEKEGFDSYQEFINCWNRIHPRKKYNPFQLIWAHFFKRR